MRMPLKIGIAMGLFSWDLKYKYWTMTAFMDFFNILLD